MKLAVVIFVMALYVIFVNVGISFLCRVSGFDEVVRYTISAITGALVLWLAVNIGETWYKAWSK